MTVLYVAAAAALGAVARYVVDYLVERRARGGFPLGTFVVNVSGSFLLGVLAGITTSAAAGGRLRLVLGTGFCGAYTTFSTLMFESYRLLEDRSRAVALANLIGSLVAGVGAVAVGYWLGASA